MNKKASKFSEKTTTRLFQCKLDKNVKNKNLFSRFFRKVTNVFSKDSAEKKLNGRMCELVNSTTEILKQLTGIKEWLKTFSDPKIYSLGISIIDPMISEIVRFQKNAAQATTTTASQVKTVSKSAEWVERTKTWLELKENKATIDQIEKFIILHTTESFQTLVTKDIQLIQDYVNQATDRKRLKVKLVEIPKLNSALTKIMTLQEIPSITTLDLLVKWRAKSDTKRERFLSEALHSIDLYFA